jgi:hypothetical protein
LKGGSKISLRRLTLISTDFYASARQAFENRLKTWTTDTLRLRIMGVGFFDRPHGQYGAAPNYIELHSVLGIDFP